MQARLSPSEVVPDGYRLVQRLEGYVRSRVPSHVLRLVKLRASNLNSCGYCLDLHTREALREGEDPRRIVGVASWHESPFFTDEERVVLAFTDALTRVADGGVSDELWDRTVELFGAEETADLSLAIATINVWNRLAIAARLVAPPLAA